MIGFQNLLLVFLSAVLLAFPFLFPVVFPAAWIALVPFFIVLQRSEGIRRAFLVGWLMGATITLLGFYWLVYTISVFGGFSYGLSVLIFLLYAVLEGLQIALFALLVSRFGFGPLNLFPPLFWVAIEFWFPHLFPWQLASSQSQFLLLIQTADIVGPYGTTFLLVWLSAIIYLLLFQPTERTLISYLPVAVFSAVIASTLYYGNFRLSAVTAEMRAAPKLSLAAVQGNIGIKKKWNVTDLKNNLRVYLELTKKSRGAKLVIWPESAVEEWLPENTQQLPPALVDPLESDSSFLIFGTRSFRGKAGGPNVKAFNSAFLVDGRGRVLSRYHKQILLAFGEYIPFSKVLSKLPGVPDMGDGFTAGDGPRTLNLSEAIRIAALICYEDLMPDLSRRFVTESKANLLVNLTNDAWYGRTVAPWQHAHLALWRTIETRRNLVRVTNTGVTAVIDPRGEMVQTLPIFTPGVLLADVELMEGTTLYVRYGDWFAWMITLMSLGIILWRRAVKRRTGTPL